MIVVCGHRARSVSASVATAPMRCSQLSSTSSSFLSSMECARDLGVSAGGSIRQILRTSCHRRWNDRGIRQGCQFDQPAAAGEFPKDSASGLQGDARFADAPWPGQRHRTIGGYEVPAASATAAVRPMRCVTVAGKIGDWGFGFDPHVLRTDGRRRRVLTACVPVAQKTIAVAWTPVFSKTTAWTECLADRPPRGGSGRSAPACTWRVLSPTIAPGQMRSSSSSLAHEFARRTGENFDDLECSPTDRQLRKNRRPEVRGKAAKVDLCTRPGGMNQPGPRPSSGMGREPSVLLRQHRREVHGRHGGGGQRTESRKSGGFRDRSATGHSHGRGLGLARTTERSRFSIPR